VPERSVEIKGVRYIAEDDIKKTGTTIDQGVIQTIDKLKEVPLRTLEALLEGLDKDPVNFAVLGLGFICGYESIDIMGVMMKPFKDILGNVTDLTKLAGGPIIPQFDLSAVAMGPMGLLDLVKLVGGPLGLGDKADLSGIYSIFPNKHVTPASKNPNMVAPGVSYYGPPPTGFTGPWPPYGTTLANLEDEKNAAADENKWKYDLEQWWLDQKVKIVMGCTGAIIAYMITRPGFVTGMASAVAESIKGLGEIVPL